MAACGCLRPRFLTTFYSPSHFAAHHSLDCGARQLHATMGLQPASESSSLDLHILTAKMYAARGASMDEPTTDVIQGTLDLLILKSLSLEPMHGFGIARRIEQVSRGVFKVNPGSLLTAF